MSKFKKGLNRLIAELVEHASDGGLCVRKWVLPEQKDCVTATSINPVTWAYTSTICPPIWDKKKAEPTREAVSRAVDLFDQGYHYFRVCVAPKRPIPLNISLEEQEARARSFFDDEAHACARINADLHELGFSLVLVAQHVAIREGRLDPHAHYLLAVAPDDAWQWSETDARRQVVDRVECHHLADHQHSPHAAEATNAARGYLDRAGLVDHVEYCHGYPIRAYAADAEGGEKLPLRDAIEHPLFLRAVAALACPAFTFKGSVVVAGWLRRSSIKIDKTGPIHVAPRPAPEVPIGTMEETEEGLAGSSPPATEADCREQALQVQEDFTASLFPQGEPLSPAGFFADLGLVLASEAPARERLPRAPVPRGRDLVQLDFVEALLPVEPQILHVLTRPSRVVEGLEETVALLRGVRGWSRLQIEERFPYLAETWRRERLALRYAEAGMDDADVVELLTLAG